MMNKDTHIPNTEDDDKENLFCNTVRVYFLGDCICIISLLIMFCILLILKCYVSDFDIVG